MIAVALVPIGIAFGAPPVADRLAGLGALPGHRDRPAGRRPARRHLRAAPALPGRHRRWSASPASSARSRPTSGVLIAARVLLGFGTCAGYPAAMYLIRSEAARTGHDSPAGVLTALAVANQTIAVIGPTARRPADRRRRLARHLRASTSRWRSPASSSARSGCPRTPRAGGQRGRPGRAARPAGHGAVRRDARLAAAVPDEPAARATGTCRWSPSPPAPRFAVRELRARRRRSSTCGCSAATRRCWPPTAARCSRYIVSYAFLYGFTQWLEEGRGLSAVARPGLVLLPMFAGRRSCVSRLTGRRPEIRGKLLVGARRPDRRLRAAAAARRRQPDLAAGRSSPWSSASRRA